MTATKRKAIRDKFGGLCAYTGRPLGDDWQVDHIDPALYCRLFQREANRDENLVPALRIVNHYKRCQNLEEFRQFMLTFHERLKKLPKTTRVEKSAKRVRYMLSVAEAFGITPDKPFTGKFYFENMEDQP
jgi:hypothetical protein